MAASKGFTITTQEQFIEKRNEILVTLRGIQEREKAIMEQIIEKKGLKLNTKTKLTAEEKAISKELFRILDDYTNATSNASRFINFAMKKGIALDDEFLDDTMRINAQNLRRFLLNEVYNNN